MAISSAIGGGVLGNYQVYAANQLVTVKQQFVFDQDLDGKKIQFGTSFVGGLSPDEIPEGDGTWIIEYDSSVGSQIATYCGGAGESNFLLSVEPDDILPGTTFVATYQFFNNGLLDSAEVVAEPDVEKLQILAAVQDEIEVASILISAYTQRDQDVQIYLTTPDGQLLNGWNPDGNTRIHLRGTGNFTSDFYINANTSDQLSYATVDDSVSQIGEDIYASGLGWRHYVSDDAGEAFVELTIEDDIDISVVYGKGTFYNSEYIEIDKHLDNPDGSEPCPIGVISGSVTSEIIANGTSASNDSAVVYPGQNITLRATMDKASYNTALQAGGGTGTFDSNLTATGLCIKDEIAGTECTGQNGVAISNELTYVFTVPVDWVGDTKYFLFSWSFSVADVDGQRCEHVIMKEFAIETQLASTVGVTSIEDDNGDPIGAYDCIGDIVETANGREIVFVLTGPIDGVLQIEGDIEPLSAPTNFDGSGNAEVRFLAEDVDAWQQICFTATGEDDPDGSGACAETPTLTLDITSVSWIAGIAEVDIEFSFDVLGEWFYSMTYPTTQQGDSETRSGKHVATTTEKIYTSTQYNVNTGLVFVQINVIFKSSVTDCRYTYFGGITLINGSNFTCNTLYPNNIDCNDLYQATAGCTNTPGIQISCSDGTATAQNAGSLSSGTSTDELYWQSDPLTIGSPVDTNNRIDTAVRHIVYTDSCPETWIYKNSLCE